MKEIFPGVWKRKKDLLTKNLIPGYRSHSEEIVKISGQEYRIWDPYKSKPAAAIMKGLTTFPIREGTKILYLGISSGKTSTFFSDIIGPQGIIYGIEISSRSIRDLNPVAEVRKNIIPIMADARKPETYDWIEKVDVLFQDVATNDQTEIIIRNAKLFLKPNGFAMYALKARSIDVIKNPKTIYLEEEKKLKTHFRIIQKLELDPYEKDHAFFLMKPSKQTSSTKISQKN